VALRWVSGRADSVIVHGESGSSGAARPEEQASRRTLASLAHRDERAVRSVVLIP
jgi:hypothetical protein